MESASFDHPNSNCLYLVSRFHSSINESAIMGREVGSVLPEATVEDSSLDKSLQQQQQVPCSKLGDSKKPAFDLPVQAFEDANEVPLEFVSKEIPILCSIDGDVDDDDSYPELPIIDMAPLMMASEFDSEAADKVKAEIGRACEEWGFFQAVNHGMSESFLDEVLAVSKEFFLLPLEEKLVYAVKPGTMEGYGRVGVTVASRLWNDLMRHTVRPKPSPEEDVVPAKPEAYRPLIEEYTAGVERLIETVCGALCEHLGLESSAFKDVQEPDSSLVMRLNYYPKCPQPDKVNGQTAHQDLGMITALLQDQVGGLQVQKPGETAFLDVKPKKGAILVNIAKQIEILSNGRYKPVVHKVVVNQKSARLSVASFFYPGPTAIIQPFPALLDDAHPPLFRSLIFGDFFPNHEIDAKAGVSPFARYEINRST